MKTGENCKVEYKATVGHKANGKAIRKSFYGKTKREAKLKAEKWILDNAVAAQKNGESGSSISFEELSEQYYSQKSPTVRENTNVQYRTVSKLFLNEFGHKRIDRITRAEVTKFVTDLSEKYSQNYIKTILAHMSSLFRFGIDNGYISVNPCYRIKYKSKIEANVKNVYTEEEAEKIIGYSLTRADGLSVDIMLSYGTTISETLGIQYDDVDFEHKLIHIRRSVTLANSRIVIDEPKNEHRKRIIVVSDRTLEHIRKFHDTKHKYLIYDTSLSDPYHPAHWRKEIYNRFMTSMQCHFEDEGDIIEKLNPHELRHTRASIWVNNNVNLFAIAEQMGWSDLEMLRNVYGHPDTDKLREMLNV